MIAQSSIKRYPSKDLSRIFPMVDKDIMEGIYARRMFLLKKNRWIKELVNKESWK